LHWYAASGEALATSPTVDATYSKGIKSMTPKELAEKHNIPRSLLPSALLRNYRSVDSYLSPASSDIPGQVMGYCWLLDFYLSHGGSLQEYVFSVSRNFCGTK
jgi:hypothetical protein